MVEGAMDERQRRIGENEVLYRAVNERIEGLNEAFGRVTDSMVVVCECGNGACAEQIELDIPTYERIRSDPTQFVVKPGHEEPDVEAVIERTATYHVVRKRPGGPAELAASEDPRS
jgi:hypothetical protein